MDLYLTSSEPGLTLQEMIDCDIKCGVEFEDGLLGVDHFMQSNELDLSGVSHLDADMEFKMEPLFDPLDKLEEDEQVEAVEDTPSDPAIGSWMNFNSMSNMNVDLEHAIMVDPSAVLPSPLHGAVSTRSATQWLSVSAPSNPEAPKGSPASKKLEDANQQLLNRNQTRGIQTKEAPSARLVLHPVNTTNVTTQTAATLCLKNGIHTPTYLSTALTRGSSSPIITIPSTLSHTNTHNTATVNNIHPQQGTVTATTLISTISGVSTPVYQNRINVNATQVTHRVKPLPKYKRERTPDERSFPKPAYSYSCLIALALKNSITGSLPVSEIYSFMCEHFPYFRTAPNGWKNSVRHNLSLNKCFEKIEKPVVSGSNQRKGCLWALNPAKAHKMDEEVQKWSKKDLQGIRDAMTNPDMLENLERGEVKFEATSSGASSCSEDEEEEDVDPLNTGDLKGTSDIHSIRILNPLTSPVVLSQSVAQKSTARVIQADGIRTINTITTKTLTQSPSTKQVNSITSQTENGILTSIRKVCTPRGTVQEEPEFILPDSTMQEINIQSNGAIIDDFGNEIKIEGELGVLNPATNTTNLILRKGPHRTKEHSHHGTQRNLGAQPSCNQRNLGAHPSWHPENRQSPESGSRVLVVSTS